MYQNEDPSVQVWADVSWTTLVTALERLVNIDYGGRWLDDRDADRLEKIALSIRKRKGAKECG